MIRSFLTHLKKFSERKRKCTSSPVKECICINVGKCGIQVGNAMWELFCLEHGIQADGKPMLCGDFTDGMRTFFHLDSPEKVYPRAVLVDLEPTVIDEIRVGKFRDLLHPDQMICGKEGGANIYARGYYTVGKKVATPFLTSVRKVVEQCENLQGFLFFSSCGGGTGSGLGSLVKGEILQDYPKKNRLEYLVSPTPLASSSVVEPYNAILSIHNMLKLQYSGCTFLNDNEALFDICRTKLCASRVLFPTVNRIVAQVVSSATASLRFGGILNVVLSDLHMNLVPFPRLEFLTSAYAPITKQTSVLHDEFSVQDITRECFKNSSQLVKCDASNGKLIACCLLYRGDLVPTDVGTSIKQALKGKKSAESLNWCNGRIKFGINCQTPFQLSAEGFSKGERSVCMLASTSAIEEPLDRIASKFDLMYSKKAFIHWYTSEGMEEEEFIESRYDVEKLKSDYSEVIKKLGPEK